jgi:hypothetical protein
MEVWKDVTSSWRTVSQYSNYAQAEHRVKTRMVWLILSVKPLLRDGSPITFSLPRRIAHLLRLAVTTMLGPIVMVVVIQNVVTENMHCEDKEMRNR